MDYEKMWKELKKIICNSEIIQKMNKLEEKYNTKYLCIKDYDNDNDYLLFKYGEKYEVIDQDEYWIYVQSNVINEYNEKEEVGFGYTEFNEYFKEQ